MMELFYSLQPSLSNVHLSNVSIHGTRKRELVVPIIITVYATCSNLDEIFIRPLSTDLMGNQ
ncbi:unnamed protein product, partial [Rotaria socialis]